MHLNGFNVEILIDHKPLQEVKAPINSTMKTTTGASYIIEESDGNKYESGMITYAAVPQSETRFSVRFSVDNASENNIYIAELYVDGKHDHRYRTIRSSEYKTKDYFWNASRDNKCYFKFTNLMTGNGNQYIPPTKGGLGAVSIYFYKGKKIEERMIDPPEFILDHNTKINEDKRYAGIMYATAFDIDEGKAKSVRNAQKADHSPVAVLHLHYRPAIWLVSQGFNLPSTYYDDNDMNDNDGTQLDEDIPMDINEIIHPVIKGEDGESIKLDSLHDVKIEVNDDEMKMDVETEMELDAPVKKENLDDENVGIVLSDEDRAAQNKLNSKKRHHNEIIEISDDDEKKPIIIKTKKTRFYATKFINFT